MDDATEREVVKLLGAVFDAVIIGAIVFLSSLSATALIEGGPNVAESLLTAAFVAAGKALHHIAKVRKIQVT